MSKSERVLNNAHLALAIASSIPRQEHHTHRHEIHEHRAPTDASVRLLREMEAAAQSQVVAMIKTEDNTLSVAGIIQEDFDRLIMGGCKLTLKVKLNGRDHTLSEQLPGRYEARTPQEWGDKVREMVAAFVTNQVLRELEPKVLVPAVVNGTLKLDKR